MKRPLPRLLALAVLVAFVAFTASDASACPNCKSSVTKDESAAFGYSIYFMLGTVFSLAGFVVWKITKVARHFDELHG